MEHKTRLLNTITYTIRDAALADAEEIAAVHFTAWQESYQGIIEQAYLDKLALTNLIEMRKKILSDKTGIHLVALANDKIVAYYDANHLQVHSNQIILSHDFNYSPEIGEVLAIYILGDYKRAGIGRALFEAGKARFKARGITSFILWVLQDNLPAIKFYESMGGKLSGKAQAKVGRNLYYEIAYHFAI